MLRLCAVEGAVPLKLSVAGVNVSQEGSGCPLARVAVYVSVSAWGSVKVLAGRVRAIVWPSFQVCVAV
jgi:hypothetical protein